MFAHGGYCFFLWAGDSRAYRLRGGDFVQLTEDHKLTQRMNALTRAVGIRENLKLDLCYTPVQHGDRFLLCSDGLYNSVEPGQICTALGQGSPKDACDSLVDLALEGGGRDNITVVIVEADQSD
jgi:protein phosphatase